MESLAQELRSLQEQYLIPKEPLFTLDELCSLKKKYKKVASDDELDKFIIKMAINLIDAKIKMYDKYPFFADETLDNFNKSQF